MSFNLYRNAFAIIVAALFSLALYWMLAPFWGALAWGICLAFLLAPVQRWLTHKLNGRASLAAALITVTVPFLLAGPLLSLGAAFANQVAELVTRLQQTPLRFDVGLLAQLEQNPFIGSLAEWLRDNLTATSAQLQSWLVSASQMLMKALAATGGNFLLGALNTAIHFFMMLFLLFFFLRDGRQMLGRAVRLVPLESQQRSDLLKLIGETTRAVVYGEVMTAIAQGALVGIGFAIAGLPSAVVFGVLAAFLALLPMIGAAFVWVPAVIYLAATSEWGWAIFLLVWGAGVSVADNLLRPLLIARHAPVSILAVFVGVIGGVSAFGMIGVIIGPVLLTVIAALLHFFDEAMARQP